MDILAPLTDTYVGRHTRWLWSRMLAIADGGPALLILCSIAASPIEEPMVTARREIAEHIARCHAAVRVEWVQTGHDAMLFDEIEATAARIREFRLSTRQLSE